MKRNLMLMGGKTYIISLPAGWIKKHGLKKGQELEVEDENNKVTISASGFKTDRKSLTIECAKQCREKLIKAYQLGYDEVKLSGGINHEEIQQVINDFMPGFEIISARKGLSIIRCISEIAEIEVEPLLRRALLLISGTGKLSALRLINMCKRAISKKGYNNYGKSLLLYSLLSDMEKAATGITKGRISQDIPLRFTEIGFEDISSENLFASPMQEIALARESTRLGGC